MIQNEQIITKWAPVLLKMELDNLLWKDDNHIQVKKLWEYVKAQNLQDPKDKRVIRADDKLRPVFGKDSVNMFELAGIVGKHLTP